MPEQISNFKPTLSRLLATFLLSNLLALFATSSSADRLPFPNGTKVKIKSDINRYLSICKDCQIMNRRPIIYTGSFHHEGQARASEVFIVRHFGNKTALQAFNSQYLYLCSGCKLHSSTPVIAGTRPSSGEMLPAQALFDFKEVSPNRFRIVSSNGRYWTRFHNTEDRVRGRWPRGIVSQVLASYYPNDDRAAGVFEISSVKVAPSSTTGNQTIVTAPPCKGKVRYNSLYLEDETLTVLETLLSQTGAYPIYEFYVEFDCDGKYGYESRTSTKHLLIGAALTESAFNKVWKSDGCSSIMEAGDKENWEGPCNVHDYMWEFIAPDGRASEWRQLADQALKINSAWVCKHMWPAGSPGLGGCFDGARNTYNYLTTWGKPHFDDNQKKKSYSLSNNEYQTYKAYIEGNDVPDFFTTWNPDQRGIFIK